jgi:hypothetical protein
MPASDEKLNTSSNKSSIKSGVPNKQFENVIGLDTPKKSKDQIADANSPRARGKAPGSVRV